MLVELVVGMGVSVASGVGILEGLSSSLVLFIVAMLLIGIGAQLSRRLGRFEGGWFQARAVAETAKSIQWLYAMRVGALRDDREAEGNLRFQLEDARRRYSGLLGLPEHVSLGDEITQEMKSTRELPTWEDRRKAYLASRVQDQIIWYIRKAKRNRHISSFYGWSVVAFQIAGVTVAVTGILTVNLGTAVALSVLATTIASVLGWSQSRRYSELVEPYLYTAQALEEVKWDFEKVEKEEGFQELVNETEHLISREHQMWQWSRGLNVGRLLGRRPHDFNL